MYLNNPTLVRAFCGSIMSFHSSKRPGFPSQFPLILLIPKLRIFSCLIGNRQWYRYSVLHSPPSLSNICLYFYVSAHQSIHFTFSTTAITTIDRDALRPVWHNEASGSHYSKNPRLMEIKTACLTRAFPISSRSSVAAARCFIWVLQFAICVRRSLTSLD